MASREDLVDSGGSVFSSELLKTFLHQARYNISACTLAQMITFCCFNVFTCPAKKIWRELLVPTPSRATLQQQFSSILQPSLNRPHALPLPLPPAAHQQELELY